MSRELRLGTTNVLNTVITPDNTDLVIQTLPNKYISYTFENLSLEPIYVAMGQDTALGTRGKPIAACMDDGAGAPVPGTGGWITFDSFVGDLYFYSLNLTELRMYALI
jgi:hypothetical protein